MMKITAVTVSDFKRIRRVEVAPESDRVLILIGGKNAAGKTSLMDALDAAFGGKNAVLSDPVRHGADSASIRIDLSGDSGSLVVRRVIRPGGVTSLEVRQDGAKIRAPQEALNALIGHRFLDPLEFLTLTASEQRAKLLQLVANADKLAELDEAHRRAFDVRKERTRDLKRAQAELDRIPEVPEGPSETISIRALHEEAEGLRRQLADHDRLAARVSATGRQAEATKAEIDRLQQELQALYLRHEEEVAIHQRCISEFNASTVIAPAARLQDIAGEIDRAQAHNAHVGRRLAQLDRRNEVVNEVDGLKLSVDTIQARLDQIAANKATILESATMPVEGLTIGESEVLLNGTPLAQASGSERLRVALALAIAAAPDLRDVWIRDGALLDEDSLELVAKQAAAAGVRVWVERVGTRDPGCIVIRDGSVIYDGRDEGVS